MPWSRASSAASARNPSKSVFSAPASPRVSWMAASVWRSCARTSSSTVRSFVKLSEPAYFRGLASIVCLVLLGEGECVPNVPQRSPRTPTEIAKAYRSPPSSSPTYRAETKRARDLCAAASILSAVARILRLRDGGQAGKCLWCVWLRRSGAATFRLESGPGLKDRAWPELLFRELLFQLAVENVSARRRSRLRF